MRRPTPGTVLGIIAIVLALSGSAFAAQRYVINSKDQIAPSVRKALKGKQGKQGKVGPVGKTGPQGVPGTTGLAGPAGPIGETGPTGPQGEPGPSAVTLAFNDGPDTVPVNTINRQEVGAPIPAPGKYLAIAKIAVTPNGTGEVACSLLSYANELSGGYDVAYARGDGVTQTLSLTYAGSFASPVVPGSGFGIYCSTSLTNTTTSMTVKFAKIALVKTGAATIVAG